jgi:inner membrane protein
LFLDPSTGVDWPFVLRCRLASGRLHDAISTRHSAMTTPEHTLVGIHLAFACGLHRQFGWKGVAMAGVASNVPDWDGIPMLIDMQRFEVGHRVWGHNVASIVVASLLLGWTQWAFDWIGRIGNWVSARFLKTSPQQPDAASKLSDCMVALVFVIIAMIVQLVHLPCDMVVSGGHGLTDWALQPWWPFSSAAYVFPLIPWGDIGPTVILMSGIIVIAKWRSRIRATSTLTLVALCAYLFARGWFVRW